MSHYYKVDLTLEPEKSFIKATVNFRYTVPVEQTQLQFILHRDLQLTAVQADHLQGYYCTGPAKFPFTPEGVTWQLQFAAPLPVGTDVEISFHYEGTPVQPMCQPWGINRLTARWVELGNYTPWFPWDPSSGPFTYDISLSMHSSYVLAGTGNITMPSLGNWHITEPMPVEDMVLLASPDLIGINAASAEALLTVDYLPEEDSAVMNNLIEESQWLLGFYKRWLNQAGLTRQCSIVVAPRVTGGGYARPGLIVLSSISGEAGGFNTRLFRHIGHELAHLWWTGAPVDSWEDWLNESFAEYSALTALRARYGPDALSEVIEQRAGGLKTLPPIRGLARTHENAYPVLYFKGSFLLLELEALIGREKMNDLLRAMRESKIQATADFLDLLSSMTSNNIAQKFDTWLSQ